MAKKRTKTPSYHGEQGQYLGDPIDQEAFLKATGDPIRERNVSLRSPHSKVARKDWDTEIIKRERKGIKMDFKKGGAVAKKRTKTEVKDVLFSPSEESDSDQNKRWGREVGEERYPREKRAQESLGQPARAIRKGTTYIKEQYGDARDSFKGMVTGDPSHGEFRKGEQESRKKHLGYRKGGYVEKLKRGNKS